MYSSPIERAREDADYHMAQIEFWSAQGEKSPVGADPIYIGLRRHSEALREAQEREIAHLKGLVIAAETTIEEYAARLRAIKTRRPLSDRRREIERARRIIERETDQPATQAAIAEYLGLTASRVSQIIRDTDSEFDDD